MRRIDIDASGQTLGRLATHIAIQLRGKDKPDFRPDRLADVTVHVTNAKDIRFSGKKLKQKMYYHFSGYPGGLKKTSAAVMMANPRRVLELAVKRMLPKNRLQARLMRHLLID